MIFIILFFLLNHNIIQTQSISYKTVGRSDIFEMVTGLPEDIFNKKIHSLSRARPKVNDFVKKQLAEHHCSPGFFELCSIDFLRQKTDNAQPFDGQPTISIITYNFNDSENLRDLVDIGSVQAKTAQPLTPDSNNQKLPIIQLASRLHCLEGGSNRMIMNTNNIIGSHAVQGEEAAISAMPANIWRMYCLTDQETNLLSYLGIRITERGSAFFKNPNAPERANNRTIFDEIATTTNPDHYIKKVAVGIHKNAQIVTGLSCVERSIWTKRINTQKTPCPSCAAQTGKQHKIFCRIHNRDDANQLVLNQETQPVGVHQVCSAALDLSVHGYNQSYSSSIANDQKCAELILHAMYEGTIRAAVYCGTQDIFLTLVGCGAFKNNPLWVANAIERMMPFIMSKNLRITITFMHDGKTPIETNNYFQNLAKFATTILHH